MEDKVTFELQACKQRAVTPLAYMVDSISCGTLLHASLLVDSAVVPSSSLSSAVKNFPCTLTTIAALRHALTYYGTQHRTQGQTVGDAVS